MYQNIFKDRGWALSILSESVTISTYQPTVLIIQKATDFKYPRK